MNLRPQQAARELGVGLTKLWALVKHEPGFPQPIKLGPRTTVFRQEDLSAWMQLRVTLGSTHRMQNVHECEQQPSRCLSDGGEQE